MKHYMKHIPFLEYDSAIPKLLIGLDYAHLAAPQRTLRGSIDTPTIMNSDLCWIIYGSQASDQHQDPCQCYHIRLLTMEARIDELVRDSFETENYPSRGAISDGTALARGRCSVASQL